jgi:hypothetical protein
MVMGGFVLEIGGVPIQVVVDGELDMEFQHYIFPNLTEKQIYDRCKGDALSKLVVISQLGWFLAQCTARAAQQLTITELELVTAAYATTAVLI